MNSQPFNSTFLLAFTILLFACSPKVNVQQPATKAKEKIVENVVEIKAGKFSFEIDSRMNVKINSKVQGTRQIMSDFQCADYLVIDGHKVEDFVKETVDISKITDGRGGGKQLIVKGKSATHEIEKVTTYKHFSKFPDFIFTQTIFTNNSTSKQIINSWNSNHISLENKMDSPSYYTFQGSSKSDRADWVRKVDEFFYNKNFMGMNNLYVPQKSNFKT